jgi:hypothetical protein
MRAFSYPIASFASLVICDADSPLYPIGSPMTARFLFLISDADSPCIIGSPMTANVGVGLPER